MNTLIPVLIAVGLTIVNSSNFLTGVRSTKTGEVYLGTTHYFEDYFLYLSQFFQGARGQGWLTANRYTSEQTPASILFWPNVLLGKLGGMFGLSPMVSYNLSIIILTFITVITIYRLQRRIFPGEPFRALVAFLFSVSATSAMNHIWVDGRSLWYPFQLWKTPNFAFDRLGAVPHQLVQTLLFLLLIDAWFFFRSKRLPAVLLSTFLLVLITSLNPVMSALFLVAAWGAALVQREKRVIVGLLILSATFTLATFYYLTLTNQQPHIQSKLWEAGQQITTTPLFMLLSIGPISLLGTIGAVTLIKRARPIELFSIVLLATGYALYFSPIPKIIGISNSRVLFPAMYASWGILGVLGLETLAILFHKYVSQIKVSLLTVFLSCLYLIVSLPTLKWELAQKLLVKPEERVPLLYLPNDVYEGFSYLGRQGSFDDVVLANPVSHMDAMVPALTVHTGYTGHPFATIASDKKRTEASRFFQRQMTADEAKL
ncbi:hypothetical protein HY411_01520, partial [Candidatus Gottesmanbacteria bacterium]|nr:hypothetical protein [Candidatus Gottesmanbacteria bacterium]